MSWTDSSPGGSSARRFAYIAVDDARPAPGRLIIQAQDVTRAPGPSWTARDISLNMLHEALVEPGDAMPVSRVYLGSGQDREPDGRLSAAVSSWPTGTHR